MSHLFVFLQQATRDSSNGPTLGPFELLPQNLGAWLAIIMSGIALWAHIKQRAAKSVDLDGLGGRVGAMEKLLSELKGKVDALAILQSNFINGQNNQSERLGSVQRVVEDCEGDGKELRREAIARLDKIREDQQTYATRLTRMEERLKISPP